MSSPPYADPTQIIQTRLFAAAKIDPELRPATNPKFGHYQSNVALRLAADSEQNPRQIAQQITEHVDLSDICEPLQIAGPGFINVTLRSDVLAQGAEHVRTDSRQGITDSEPQQRVVVDSSAPNVAKQMHVGHLRSTIIGDALTNTLRAGGNQVIAQNHIGDWGRQFGMLIEQAKDEAFDLSQLDLRSAEDLYRRANTQVKNDPEFADRARGRVVKFQSGDQDSLALWRTLVNISLAGFNQVYQRLGVGLTDADIRGESFYNDQLAKIADDLQQQGIAVEDQGALVAFTDGYDAPLIIRNSHGGYGYAVTDLAAVRFRVNELGAQRIIYVVGSEQTQHFDQVFQIARKAGYLPPQVEVEHVAFGHILGKDGKKFSTREGTAVTLTTLLDEAEAEVPPNIAMAAVKYADLQNSLNRDYRFDLDRMTQSKGNTGPYLQYAHARCHQILRKAAAESIQVGPISTVAADIEQSLALQLSKFGSAVAEVEETLQPHRLCTYLFDLAETFSSFYEQCPVLKSEGETRNTRLGLTAAVSSVLATGLGLLGIDAPDYM